MNEELKPCPVPWCESDVLEPVRSIWSHNYSIICQECRAQGPSLATKAEAIAAWNRRAPDTHLAAAEAERDAARKFARQTHDLYNQAICELVDARAVAKEQDA